jgi:cold shock protein
MGKYRDHRSSRSDRFESDRHVSEPSYFQSRSEARAAAPPSAAVGSKVASPPRDAEVIWFNAEKGFGFVRLSDGSDAFLHVSKLQAVDHSKLPDGTKLRVLVELSAKGKLQVNEVLSIDGGEEASIPPPKASPVEAGEQEGVGTVKRYDAVKGFGFITLENGGKDVFVHSTTVSRCGLAPLERGQKVIVGYVQGQKGPEARTLRRV